MYPNCDYEIQKTWLVIVDMVFLWLMVAISCLSPIFVILSLYQEGGTALDALRVLPIVIALCIAILYTSLTLIKFLTQKVWFEQGGLRFQCFGEKEKRIPWQDFQQICVCYAAYTTRGPQRAHSALVCVKKGERVNGLLRWKTDNFFHFRSVITMDFTPERYEKLQSLCGSEIVDLRETLAYKL